MESGQQKLQKVAKDKQDILTKMFYGIFNGKKKIPLEEIDTVFNTYLADASLSIEKTKEGKSFPKINSMRAVIRYLKEHQEVSSCDFSTFKTEINDVSSLAEYLKNSKVTVITLKKAIPEAAKASLAEAVAARNGGLKVQYFD